MAVCGKSAAVGVAEVTPSSARRIWCGVSSPANTASKYPASRAMAATGGVPPKKTRLWPRRPALASIPRSSSISTRALSGVRR